MTKLSPLHFDMSPNASRIIPSSLEYYKRKDVNETNNKFRGRTEHIQISRSSNHLQDSDMPTQSDKQLLKRILFYNPSVFQLVRNITKTSFFKDCHVNNCEMTLNKSEASHSDAVIIHSRHRYEFRRFNRPVGQIWIAIQHEAPITYAKTDDRAFKVYINIKFLERQCSNYPFILIVNVRPLSVGLWLIVHFIQDSLVAICWEGAVPLDFHLCCFYV